MYQTIRGLESFELQNGWVYINPECKLSLDCPYTIKDAKFIGEPKSGGELIVWGTGRSIIDKSDFNGITIVATSGICRAKQPFLFFEIHTMGFSWV